MPIIVHKLGAHRNEEALRNLVYYMLSSEFFKGGGSRGIFGYSAESIIQNFEFAKQMYEKTDGKQVAHIIIGTEKEGLIEEELMGIAETAMEYFFSSGFQCCYALHRGSVDNQGYLHVHMAVNTVNAQNGRRLYESYSVTGELKTVLSAQYSGLYWSSVNDSSATWET